MVTPFTQGGLRVNGTPKSFSAVLPLSLHPDVARWFSGSTPIRFHLVAVSLISSLV